MKAQEKIRHSDTTFENYFIKNIIYFQSFKLFHYEKVDCLK